MWSGHNKNPRYCSLKLYCFLTTTPTSVVAQAPHKGPQRTPFLLVTPDTKTVTFSNIPTYYLLL